MKKILSNTEQVKKHLPVNAGLDFETLQPFMERAFRRTVLPHLTKAQYEAMVDYAGAEDAETMQQLQHHVEAATVNLGSLLAIPHTQVQVSDAGITMPSGEHKKTAYRYMVQALEQSYCDAGYEALEDMLRLLDENRELFTQWAESEAAKDYKRLFIPTTEEFEKYQPLNGSRLLFRGLAAIMYQVQLMEVSGVLGDRMLFSRLKTYHETGVATDSDKALFAELFPLVKGFIANRSLADGIIRRSIILSSDGVLQLNIRSEDAGRSSVQADTLEVLRDEFTATALRYSHEIKDLLSDQQTADALSPVYNNTQESGIFHL